MVLLVLSLPLAGKLAFIAGSGHGVGRDITVQNYFATENDLGVAAIDFGAGPVALTAESAAKALDAVTFTEPDSKNLVVDADVLFSSKAPGAYPLILTPYSVVCSAGYPDAQTAPAMREAIAAPSSRGRRMPSAKPAAAAVAAGLTQAGQARFAALKAWRAEVAREHNLPAYVIFHDATLAAIAEADPQSLADLQGISGIGAKKLEAYGEEVLRVVASAG